MAHYATTTLTPYDTGSRLEPKLWQPNRSSVIAAMSAHRSSPRRERSQVVQNSPSAIAKPIKEHQLL